MSNLIEIKNLRKYFPTPRGLLHAVDDVSLDIEEGKTMGVVGESGCGKSTLGRVAIRLIEATSGSVTYCGEEIQRRSKRELKALRKDLQMIFQDPYESLDPRMNVSALISEPLLIQKQRLSKGELNDVVEEMMRFVSIPLKLKDSYPHELDGGTRQRVGIARALALEPNFIVCDEPVSALDVSVQAQVLNLLQDLQESKKLTYMFITHNLAVAYHISDVICVMYLGQVVEVAPRKELFEHTLHPYSQALLSAIPLPTTHDKRKRIILKSELTSPINPQPGCRFAPRCIHATPECSGADQVLRDVGNGHRVACRLAENIQ